MKAFFIRFFIFPQGLTVVSTLCIATLILLHLPSLIVSSNAGTEEFPRQRQGGGTHLHLHTDHSA